MCVCVCVCVVVAVASVFQGTIHLERQSTVTHTKPNAQMSWCNQCATIMWAQFSVPLLCGPDPAYNCGEDRGTLGHGSQPSSLCF